MNDSPLPTRPVPPTSKENLYLMILLFVNLAHVLDFVIMMPIGPLLMGEFAISAAYFGKIVASYTLAAAFSSLLSMFWMDRFDRKKVLLVLMIGFCFGNVLCAWAPSSDLLLTGRVVAGLFGGVMSAVVFSIVGQLVALERRGRATGVLATAFPLVSILGVPLGLALAHYFNWRVVFWLVLGLSLVAMMAVALLLPKVIPEGHRISVGLIDRMVGAIKFRPHQLGMITMIFVVLGGFTMVPYIAPFLIFNGFIAADQLTFIYLAGGSCSIISSRIFGLLCDRFSKAVVLRWACSLTIVSLILYVNMPHLSIGWVLFFSSLTMMFLPARFVAMMSLFTMIGHKEMRGVFMSLISSTQQLTIGLAAVIGGSLVGEVADGSLSTFWKVGLFCIICNGIVMAISVALRKEETLAMNRV